MKRCVCKHGRCQRCEKLSLPRQTSDWWICCRCRELNRYDEKNRADAHGALLHSRSVRP